MKSLLCPSPIWIFTFELPKLLISHLYISIGLQVFEWLGCMSNDYSLFMHRSERSEWIGIDMVDKFHSVRYWSSGLTMNDKLSKVFTKLHCREQRNQHSSRLNVNQPPQVSQSHSLWYLCIIHWYTILLHDLVAEMGSVGPPYFIEQNRFETGM